MRRSIDSVPEIVKFVMLTMALYFTEQAVIVILHEHAHSTAAWLLGYTPFTVVWDNPLTILGWDEGVPYDQLFRLNWGWSNESRSSREPIHERIVQFCKPRNRIYKSFV